MQNWGLLLPNQILQAHSEWRLLCLGRQHLNCCLSELGEGRPHSETPGGMQPGGIGLLTGLGSPPAWTLLLLLPAAGGGLLGPAV